MPPENATAPAGNRGRADDLLGSGSSVHHNGLSLPPLPPRVAELLAKMDPAEISRQVRVAVRRPSIDLQVLAALERLTELTCSADLDTLLSELRAEFTGIAAAIKAVAG